MCVIDFLSIAQASIHVHVHVGPISNNQWIVLQWIECSTTLTPMYSRCIPLRLISTCLLVHVLIAYDIQLCNRLQFVSVL